MRLLDSETLGGVEVAWADPNGKELLLLEKRANKQGRLVALELRGEILQQLLATSPITEPTLSPLPNGASLTGNEPAVEDRLWFEGGHWKQSHGPPQQ
jgi:hypothetical protein